MPPPRDLRSLPKAHLHLHLEGAMRPATLDAFCTRSGIERPADTRGQRFDNFSGFNAMYRAATLCIRTPEDLALLIQQVAEDAAAEGVWWIEPAFDADRYSDARPDARVHRLFDTQEEGWAFTLAAAEAASQATGVGIGFISAIDRSRPLEQGMSRAEVTADLVRTDAHRIACGANGVAGRHAGIVAIGLHGPEEGFPPEPFAEPFRVATEAGLISAPHAGEIAPAPGRGAASVAGARDHLGADRLGHGVLAAEDSALVNRLAREGVCLDVCPSSNLQLNVFPSIEDHPLPRLLDAGVICSLSSDAPLLFGPDLVDEFILCWNEMGLNDTQLAAMARHSFEHSGAPETLKTAGLAAIDAWLADEG